jgi:hypothetical protein
MNSQLQPSKTGFAHLARTGFIYSRAAGGPCCSPIWDDEVDKRTAGQKDKVRTADPASLEKPADRFHPIATDCLRAFQR